jgi:hypothetical protein
MNRKFNDGTVYVLFVDSKYKCSYEQVSPNYLNKSIVQKIHNNGSVTTYERKEFREINEMGVKSFFMFVSTMCRPSEAEELFNKLREASKGKGRRRRENA